MSKGELNWNNPLKAAVVGWLLPLSVNASALSSALCMCTGLFLEFCRVEESKFDAT